MAIKTRLLQFLTFALASAALMYGFWDHIWTQSVDLAHHYALVVRLTEFGRLPAKTDLSLGEMQIYPSASHYMAVIAGRFLGSPLAGMQFIALLAAVALWGAIGWILWSLPRPAARRTIATLLLLLLANATMVHFELFDRELVGNYFYSQLVGQSLAMLAIAVALRMAQLSISRYAVYVFLIGSTVLIESVHLLPAVELLGFLGLLMALDQISGGNWKRLTQLAASACLFLLAAAAVVAHPTFRGMRTISENNGTLPLHHIPNQYVLVGIAILVGVISTVLVIRWLKSGQPEIRRANLTLSYIGLFGLSVAILCILQVVAHALGQGSEYACRKYAFALCTILLIELAMLPTAFSLSYATPAAGRQTKLLSFFDTSAIAAIVLVSSLTSLPFQKEWSLAKLVSLERELNQLNDTAVPRGIDRSNYVARLPGWAPLIDYMFSISIFKTPRTDNAYDILRNRILSEPEQIAHIVTGKGRQPYDIEACRLATPDTSLAVIDGACFARLVPRRTVCQGWFHLTPENWLDRSVLQGFGNPEAHGTWTVGNEASLTCQLPNLAVDRPKAMRIIAQGFAPGDHVQRVAISINGAAPKEFRFDKEGEQKILELPIPANSPSLKLTFSLPDAISPEAMGIASDERKLGLYVSWIQFSVNGTFE